MSKVISGKFKDLSNWWSDHIDTPDDPTSIEGAVLELSLSHPATLPDGSPAPGTYKFALDTKEAAIPPGTAVWGNDELSPRGTFYNAEVYIPDEVSTNIKIAIIGEEPIDLRKLPELSDYTPAFEPPPKPVAPPLPGEARPRCQLWRVHSLAHCKYCCWFPARRERRCYVLPPSSRSRTASVGIHRCAQAR